VRIVERQGRGACVAMWLVLAVYPTVRGVVPVLFK
jgi:hypothetical protein